jgi:hypothetical protein
MQLDIPSGWHLPPRPCSHCLLKWSLRIGLRIVGPGEDVELRKAQAVRTKSLATLEPDGYSSDSFRLIEQELLLATDRREAAKCVLR